MKHLGKIVRINLLVLLAYSVIIRVWAISESGNGNEAKQGRSLGILILSAGVIAMHVLGSLIISLSNYNTNKDLGKAWLLTTGIVLLVGFLACLGNAIL